MACCKLLDATEFRPVEDCSPLDPSIAHIGACQVHNFDMTFIYECVRFHGISTVGDLQTAALDGARDEPGAQAVCPEAHTSNPRRRAPAFTMTATACPVAQLSQRLAAHGGRHAEHNVA